MLRQDLAQEATASASVSLARASSQPSAAASAPSAAASAAAAAAPLAFRSRASAARCATAPCLAATAWQPGHAHETMECCVGFLLDLDIACTLEATLGMTGLMLCMKAALSQSYEEHLPGTHATLAEHALHHSVSALVQNSVLELDPDLPATVLARPCLRTPAAQRRLPALERARLAGRHPFRQPLQFSECMLMPAQPGACKSSKIVKLPHLHLCFRFARVSDTTVAAVGQIGVASALAHSHLDV